MTQLNACLGQAELSWPVCERGVQPSVEAMGSIACNRCLVVQNKSLKTINEQQAATIQEQRQAIDKMSVDIRTDPLTGLLNKRGFDADFTDRNQADHPSALLSFDMKNFKWVNDYFTHETGDLALRYVATFLSSHFRTEDIVSRRVTDEDAKRLREPGNSVSRTRGDEFDVWVSLKPREIEISEDAMKEWAGKVALLLASNTVEAFEKSKTVVAYNKFVSDKHAMGMRAGSTVLHPGENYGLSKLRKYAEPSLSKKRLGADHTASEREILAVESIFENGIARETMRLANIKAQRSERVHVAQ